MHIAKNKQLRNILRRQQLNHIINSLRQQLINTHITTHTVTNTQITSLFPDIIDPQTINFLQTQTFCEQQQQKMAALLQSFQVLMQNRQNLGKQQCADVQKFAGMFWNYRLLIIYGKEKVDMLTLRNIFQYLKFRITEGLAFADCCLEDLHSQSQWENLQHNLHLLHLTLITLVSEYLNQGGTLNSSQSLNWLVDEYQKWKIQFDDSLSKTLQLIEACYDDSSKTLMLNRQLHCSKYYLDEQHKLTKVLLHYQPDNFIKQLEQLLDYNTIRMMVKLIKSYYFPDQLQLTVCLTFSEVAELTDSTLLCQSLYQNDYLQYVRLQLVIRQEYKNYTRKTKLDDSQKYTIKIISKILFTLSCMTLHNSDLLWSQGICHQIKSVVNEICHPEIKQDFITFMLQSIVYAKQPDKIYGWSELMPWVISIIQERIQESIVREGEEDELVGDCLAVIKYFLYLGKLQMEQQKLTCNPYLLQFKYLYGFHIFSKSQQCLQFLQEQLADQTQGCL